MKKQKLSKVLIAGVISGCLMTTGIALASENSNVNISDSTIQVFNDGVAVPYSMYFRSAALDVFPSNGVMKVDVKTKAFRAVDHIYHDVTIYKNGVWQSSDRYEDWGKVQLISSISVTAQSGDTVEVYVDHYTEHNGYVESSHSSKSSKF